MKRQVLLGAALALAASAPAMPVIAPDSVSAVQDSGSDRIRISYRLDNEPAVVTIDILTNASATAESPSWVSIGGARMAKITEANMLVEKTGEHTAVWRPTKAGPWDAETKDFRFVVTAWPTNAPPPYMVVDLFGGRTRYYERRDLLPLELTDVKYKTEKLVMRRIPAAGVEFVVGEPIKAAGVGGYEGRTKPFPALLTEDYYCAVFELTYQQNRFLLGNDSAPLAAYDDSCLTPQTLTYDLMRGTTDGTFANWPKAGHAVKSDSYFDYYRRRTGVQFDYLTSAQWEFACRAGTTTSLNNGYDLTAGATSLNIDDVAWYSGNKELQPRSGYQVVGLLRPNAWDLYDMHGNAWEFALDWLAAESSCDLHVDPVGPETDGTTSYTGRIVRSGSYQNAAAVTSSGMRWSQASNLPAGVRLGAPCAAVR